MRRSLGVLVVVLVGVFAGPAVASAAESPVGLTAAAGDGAVDLAWQSVAGASTYNVYRGLSASTVTTAVTPPGGVVLPGFNDTTAVNGSAYFYVVKPVVAGAESGVSVTVAATPRAHPSCPGNAITAENCFPGNAAWNVVSGQAPASGGIDAFGSAAAIAQGDSLAVKVNAGGAASFRAEIFRSGYYGGAGARLFSVVQGLQATAQPGCTSNATTGLYDCSNWAATFRVSTSASWPSGTYLIRLVREDNGHDTHVVFVVRAPSNTSDILYGVSFSTYEAYNNYGGKSLYGFNSTGANTVSGSTRAVKVSFDRPFAQASQLSSFNDWFVKNDQPTIAWLERSGYDISYISDTDLEGSPSLALGHRVYYSPAHDEYWSAGMRSAITSARDATPAVNLFVGGSNAIYWKIRFENGPNGGAGRVQVCYKTREGGVNDPSGIATTTWRDPNGPNQPENQLLGQQYIGDNSGTFFPLVVSAFNGLDRIYRYTPLAAQATGSSTSVGSGLVGWEWDARAVNGFEPPRVKTLAASAVNGNLIQNFGANYVTGSSTSNMTKYVSASGALVFATGTNQWWRGLAVNASGTGEPNSRIQQIETNVLSDMGAKPATPASGIALDPVGAPILLSTAPADAAIEQPLASKATVTFAQPMDASTITASSFTLATAGGSAVPATVTYDSTSAAATLTPTSTLAYATTYVARLATSILSASGKPLPFVNTWTFTTTAPPTTLRINTGGGAYTTTTGQAFVADSNFSGGNANSTTHAISGTSDGSLYQNERWGSFNYSVPVTNGSYDVRLHFAELYFGTIVPGGCVGKRIFGIDVINTPGPSDIPSIDICGAVGPNAALVKTISGINVTNGLLSIQSIYGSADDPQLAALEIVPSGALPPGTPPTVLARTPASGATGVATNTSVTATFSRGMDTSTINGGSFKLAKGDGTAVAATISYDASTATAALVPTAALASSTSYTATITTAAKASDGTALASAVVWSFTTAAPGAVTAVRINVGGPAYTTSGGNVFAADQYFTGGSVNSSASTISGTSDGPLYQNERWGSFSYAIPLTNGTYDLKLHFAELYYVSGSCISKRVFSVEVADTPLSPDVANLDVCAAAGSANAALVRTVANVQVADGFLNLQSIYGSADDPELTAIEVVPSAPPTGAPTVTASSPAPGAINVGTGSKVTATFSRALDPSTVSTSTFALKVSGGASVPATVAYDSSTLTATLTPAALLADSTTYSATLTTGIRAGDGTAMSAPVTWTFTTSSPASLTAVRINVGGSAYTSSTGAFSADQYFTGGTVNSSASTISGTSDGPLYQNERWGSFSYAIPVTNGTYDVKLHFAELYYGTAIPGSCSAKRIFSIDIADTAGVDVQNLDICQQVGPNAALVKTVSGAQVNDGVLNLSSVYGSADDPELTALEIVPSSGPPAPPPDPAQVGQWTDPISWPLVTVHASMLPTGNVLVFDGFDAGPNSQRVWNPTTGAFVAVPYAVNTFCAGHVTLPDGRTIVVGGHQAANAGIPDVSIFNSTTNAWTAAAKMSVGRWYPTATMLGDGRVLAFAGDNIIQDRPGALPPLSDASVNSLPEIYDPVQNTWTPFNSSTLTTPLYPFMFVLADGRVLDAGPDLTTRIFDPRTGAWSVVGTSPFDGMSAVMYRPGKIMKAGAWADPDWNGSLQPKYNATNNVAVLDMNLASPAWRSVASMAFPRSYHNLTLLPDGTVLASGGLTVSDGVDLSKSILPTEIWNPTTETWTTVAPLHIGRGYHSTALLLPDGRVLMAGGGQLPGSAAVNETNAEIYSPPYLFKGTRPTISAAPQIAQYGSTFTVSTPDAANIQSVSLVRTASVTHGFDQDQRFQFLPFTKGSGTLSVTAPATSNLAPPGYYMLFVVNGSGVPSVAKILRFPAPWEDSIAPSAPTGLTATGGLGQAQLAWTAASDNVAVTGYNIYRSTTSGFTPSAANRVAHVGAVTSYLDAGVAAGTNYYVVTAEDAQGNVSVSSNQAVAAVTADTTPPSVSITAPAASTTVSGAISVTSTASDNVAVAGVQVKLDGANLGAEDTSAPYSVVWDTSTATNGAHTLTAVARDGAGNTATSASIGISVSNTAPPPPTGLVASYNFDATSGTVLADRSGNNNNGTIANATWSTGGHSGSALSFNGTNAMVSVPDANSLDLTSGMTLEAWVNPSALGTTWRTVIFKEQAGGFAYSLYANQDTTRPVGQVSIGGEVNATGTTALTVNTWAHLAVTFDGTGLKLYVNGVLVRTTAVIGSIPVTTGSLRLGGNSIWGERFAGLLDDVRIYNRALTAVQVQADMAAAVP